MSLTHTHIHTHMFLEPFLLSFIYLTFLSCVLFVRWTKRHEGNVECMLGSWLNECLLIFLKFVVYSVAEIYEFENEKSALTD